MEATSTSQQSGTTAASPPANSRVSIPALAPRMSLTRRVWRRVAIWDLGRHSRLLVLLVGQTRGVSDGGAEDLRSLVLE